MPTYRRLLRLTLALVLVLVVMQQASKPGLYRLFFTEPSDAIKSASKKSSRSKSIPADSVNTDDHDDNGIEISLLASVSDSATWTPSDNDAFYGLLQSGGRVQGLHADARQAGVVAMLQQPQAYLKQTVSVSGKIARATRLVAKPNSANQTEYWELWMQPSDGNDLPVVAYVADVPPVVREVAGQNFVATGPLVRIEGIYLKRIAFRSRAGNELAPAIIGRMISPSFASTISSGDAAAATVVSEAASPRWGILVGLSALLGIGFAATVMIATQRASRRLRAGRRSMQTPTLDLEELRP